MRMLLASLLAVGLVGGTGLITGCETADDGLMDDDAVYQEEPLFEDTREDREPVGEEPRDDAVFDEEEPIDEEPGGMMDMNDREDIE
ncbi:MAG: hypothetical protein ACOCTI_07740, partial [Phycisphaeraceae bacterium]